MAKHNKSKKQKAKIEDAVLTDNIEDEVEVEPEPEATEIVPEDVSESSPEPSCGEIEENMPSSPKAPSRFARLFKNRVFLFALGAVVGIVILLLSTGMTMLAPLDKNVVGYVKQGNTVHYLSSTDTTETSSMEAITYEAEKFAAENEMTKQNVPYPNDKQLLAYYNSTMTASGSKITNLSQVNGNLLRNYRFQWRFLKLTEKVMEKNVPATPTSSKDTKGIAAYQKYVNEANKKMTTIFAKYELHIYGLN